VHAQFVARATKSTRPIHPVTQGDLPGRRKSAIGRTQMWLQSVRFSAKPGEVALIPGDDGVAEVWLGMGETFSPDAFGVLPQSLPAGRYVIEGDLDPDQSTLVAVAFGRGAYVFDRYKKSDAPNVELVWPDGCDKVLAGALIEGVTLGRDLINTPAQDMGPEQLSMEVQKVAKATGARCTVIEGAQLLRRNYPAVHAVGRAAAQAPRLVDLRWGKPSDPKLTLVGKGVTFDSGGLDIKPASGMLLMKKDMGGAAIALGLAQAIMQAELPVRLRLLIPAVENAISGNAFHPLDVLSTRKGITVEVGNTDAEGRLILSDALTEACSEKPDLLIDFATLTGAARVALGTEVPVMFASDDSVAEGILASGEAVFEPVWRLPLHTPYRRFLDSKVADISNVSSQSFGGAITAALFLKEFVEPEVPWVHFDVMAYNLDAQPARPQGGEAMALRAVFEYLQGRYNG
jgi:leucyl aminopeptidase